MYFLPRCACGVSRGVLAVLAAYFQHFLDLITGVTLILLGGFVVRMTDAHEGGPEEGAALALVLDLELVD
jgi:hypothetical protein